MRDSDRGDTRALIREALTRATRAREPDMTRLIESVPYLMAEARRRRIRAQTDVLLALVSQAWRGVPRFAALTAAVVILSAAVTLMGNGDSGKGAPDFESMILIGTDNGAPSDILLDAVMTLEEEHG